MAHQLSDRVPTALPEILRTAERGDWRTRAACLSAAGQRVRTESPARRLLGYVVRRIPWLRGAFADAGYQGRYVRGPISNGLADRSWPVRVAAALALGECPHENLGSAPWTCAAGSDTLVSLP